MRRWRSWFRFSLRSHESPEVAAAACSFNRFELTAAADEYLGAVSGGAARSSGSRERGHRGEGVRFSVIGQAELPGVIVATAIYRAVLC